MQQRSASKGDKVQNDLAYIRRGGEQNAYRVLFLSILAAGLLLVGSCQAQKRRGKQPPLPHTSAKPMMICRLATGGGYGPLSRYAAEFYRPSKMVYYGRKKSPLLGRHTYILPDALIKNLLLDAKTTKIMALPEQPIAPPDAPTDTLYLMLDGKARTFKFSPVNCAESLKKYAENIRANITAILEEQPPADGQVDSSSIK